MQKETQKKYLNKIRIIGGKWRGRMLSFPNISGLRPTPNRVRETLFNWLSPYIYEARCLDLFAGSGALGFEALSRGAQEVTFVDCQPAVIEALKQNRALLNAEPATIVNAVILRSIATKDLPATRRSFVAKNAPQDDSIGKTKQPYNIIFLDPPFGENLIEPCCLWLESQNLLANNALIYIEAEKTLKPVPTPTHWELLKSKTAGQVSYHLFRVVKHE